jgi:hypothetical protein
MFEPSTAVLADPQAVMLKAQDGAGTGSRLLRSVPIRVELPSGFRSGHGSEHHEAPSAFHRAPVCAKPGASSSVSCGSIRSCLRNRHDQVGQPPRCQALEP